MVVRLSVPVGFGDSFGDDDGNKDGGDSSSGSCKNNDGGGSNKYRLSSIISIM